MKKGLQLYSAGVMIMDNCDDAAAGLSALRARCGGLPGPEPEHLARAAAARPSAQGHREQPGEEAPRRPRKAAARRPRGLRKILRELRPRHRLRHCRAGRAEPQGGAAGSAALLLLDGEEARHPARVRRPDAGEPEVHLLRRGRERGGHRPPAADRAAEGQELRDPLPHR